MKLKEIMTRNPEVIPQDASIREAAVLMRDLNVGSIPVVDGKKLVGIVTDRDIVVRGIAGGHEPDDALVQDVMTDEVVFGYEEMDVNEAAKTMSDKQIRRLVVVDTEHNLIGIISLGDISVDMGQDRITGETLEKISRPSKPQR